MSTSPVEGNRIEEVELRLIEPPPFIRSWHNVKAYADLLRGGSEPEPIWVAQIPGHRFSFKIEDGAHRYMACKLVGRRTIVVRVGFDIYGYAAWKRDQQIHEERARRRNRRWKPT